MEIETSRNFCRSLPHHRIKIGADLARLQGPFGAPAQRVWEFKTVMVVGAGIGVPWQHVAIATLFCSCGDFLYFFLLLTKIILCLKTCSFEVTPFVSILRSVQIRKQQQHLLRVSGSSGGVKPGLASWESRLKQLETP